MQLEIYVVSFLAENRSTKLKLRTQASHTEKKKHSTNVHFYLTYWKASTI